MSIRNNNIKNYICITSTELPSYMQASIVVPNDMEVMAGEVFKAEDLISNLKGVEDNLMVYTPEKIEHAKGMPVIILNNGFETMSDGRRPEGQPDYTQYKYKSGEVVTALRLLPEVKFQLSVDALGNGDDIINDPNIDVKDTWLYPEIDTNKLVWTDDFNEVNTEVYLVVETMKSFRLGGIYGDDGALTMVVRVKYQEVEEVEPNPPIESVEVAPFATILNLPLEVGNVVASITITGGQSPFVCDLGELNDYFEIVEHSRHHFSVVVKEPYYDNEDFTLSVSVTDVNGETGEGERTINVQPGQIGEITISYPQRLVAGTSSVAPGATVALLNTTGKTSPFTYRFNEEISGSSNDMFIIDGNKLKVKDTALTSNYYRVSIISTDRYNQEVSKNMIIAVSAM